MGYKTEEKKDYKTEKNRGYNTEINIGYMAWHCITQYRYKKTVKYNSKIIEYCGQERKEENYVYVIQLHILKDQQQEMKEPGGN